ncbi:TIGR04283 family arsenosugar biosynthesis glycosyltransferase [Salidesulfovibrio brasiliensis]|uniref:TIGR04283 family arsenosugar biosynthesis glycosyltransferase n=1 Tax=Salidesulfovibrio brasiliensis TaxID=221711 RepID=UPI0006CFA775|nr:TIGR04283 family arsenosugar biosynthesis glycosyltransferase [Salidesulfovibrio brasiliensis]
MPPNTTVGLTSVIVPVLGEAASIGSVVENVRRAAGKRPVEIIVSDGDPSGSTLAALDDPEVAGVLAPKGRGAQMNAGARAASGDVLLFLHADTRLPDDAIGIARRALAEHDAGSFSVRYDTESIWVRFLGMVSNMRARLERVAYGDQTHFFRRDVFERLGGYPEIPIMEDVEMYLRLREEGCRVTFLTNKVWTSARRYETEGRFFRPFRNVVLRIRHRLGASPEDLVRAYRPQNELDGPEAR